MSVFFVLFSFFSTAIASVLALSLSGLNPFIAIFSLVLGAALAFWLSKDLNQRAPELKFFRFSRGDSAVLELSLFVFLIYTCYRHFLHLFFPMDQNWSTLSLTNFGDLPLHINYIRQLVYLPQFPPMNPSFAREVLLYPFGPDFFNALFESLRVTMSGHLFVVGMVSTIASLICLRVFGGWWAVGAFFLNGGFAGWGILNGSQWRDLQGSLDWKNLLLAVFIPQRGVLFALPAGLLILHFVRRHLSREVVLPRGALITLGLVWGILPLFHLHAFVIISLLLAGYALIEAGWRGLRQLFVSPLFAVAVLPATALVVRSSRGGKAASVIQWDAAWTSEVAQLPKFMLWNFGPWLLLPVALALALWWPRKTEIQVGSKGPTRVQLRWEFVLYLGLFLIFFNVKLAPWNWDNIKILIWPYLGFARLAYLIFEPFFNSKKAYGMLRLATASVLFFSGFLALVESIQAPSIRAVNLYQRGELASTEGAIASVSPQAVFASALTHNHTLTYFGRLRVAGYEGHLWSHGIDSGKVVEKLKKLMSPQPDQWRAIAKELGATHIFWGPAERQAFGDGPRPWMTELKNISRVPGFDVYAL